MDNTLKDIKETLKDFSSSLAMAAPNVEMIESSEELAQKVSILVENHTVYEAVLACLIVAVCILEESEKVCESK